MSILVLETKIFQQTENLSKRCVGCGEPICIYGLTGKGPSNGGESKETCGYNCYRDLWILKNTLRKLQDSGKEEDMSLVRVVVRLIEGGMPASKAYIVFKFYKKYGTGFIGPVSIKCVEDRIKMEKEMKELRSLCRCSKHRKNWGVKK